MGSAERMVVFTPPDTGMYVHELRAPEIHYLENKWYIYFDADDGDNANHRLWVLENATQDPMEGEWTLKGKLTTPEDKWSIDGTIYQHKGQYYLLWSGWEGDVNGQQNIYMARMSNPYTVEGKRVKISEPQWNWETVGELKNSHDVTHVKVNEGPQMLRREDKLFLIYSASGCWTDSYSLGMLWADADSDIMNPESWTKHPKPVFSKNIFGGVYAPGHNSFFKSPDGKEDWILYHANDKPRLGCGVFRSPRAQRFTWKSNGMPDFGKPVRRDKRMDIPAQDQAISTVSN
jgi:GH43 family beta-xylosidase